MPVTLPKTNNHSTIQGAFPQGKDRIPTIHFQVRTVSFKGGTLLKTSSKRREIRSSKEERLVFQPSIFRGELLASERVVSG